MQKLLNQNIIIIITFIFPIILMGQNSDFSKVSFETQKSKSKLADSVYANSDEELIYVFNSLDKKHKSLFSLLTECNNRSNLKEDYIASLHQTQVTLEQLSKNLDSLDEAKQIMKNIQMDYEAKEKSVNYGITSDANVKVKVVVNATANEGHFVYGKLSYEKKLDIKRYAFDGITNSATQNFVPGYYLFWLEKDGVKGEYERVLIIGNGVDNLKNITLQSPKKK